MVNNIGSMTLQQIVFLSVILEKEGGKRFSIQNIYDDLGLKRYKNSGSATMSSLSKDRNGLPPFIYKNTRLPYRVNKNGFTVKGLQLYSRNQELDWEQITEIVEETLKSCGGRDSLLTPKVFFKPQRYNFIK